MDTWLGNVRPFELFRTGLALSRMQPLWIVVNLDVFEHVRHGLLASSQVFTVNRLGLKLWLQISQHRVVSRGQAARVAVAFGAHAAARAMRLLQGKVPV